jgi:hypothetical protein
MMKSLCQSSFSGFHSVSSIDRGRPASGHCRHVDTPWRPYAGRGPTGQVRASLLSATTLPPPSLPPLLLSLALSTPRQTNQAAIAAACFPTAM